jgi:hypothetical protein
LPLQGGSFGKLPFQLRDHRVEQLTGAGEVATPLRDLQFAARLVELFLHFLDRL